MRKQKLSLKGKTGQRITMALFAGAAMAVQACAANAQLAIAPSQATASTVDRAGAVDFDAAMAAFNEAMAAQKAGDAAGYRHGLERAAARLADPARLLYRLAGARLAAGDRAGALAALALQVDAGFVRDPRGDEAFAALAGDPEFLALMARMDALGEPVVASTEIFLLPERDALFEGIARHPFNESLFFSSVHRRKVVQRLADGTVRDFVAPGAHGLAAALGLADRVDVHLGTLGKAAGAAGGYVAGSRALVDWLINRARSFIFSTAPMPAQAAAARAGLELLAGGEGDLRRERLLDRARRLATVVPGAPPEPDSAIMPWILGDEPRALDAAAALEAAGFFAPAIRFPSVARGAARVRFTACSEHSPEQIGALGAAIRGIWERRPVDLGGVAPGTAG